MKNNKINYRIKIDAIELISSSYIDFFIDIIISKNYNCLSPLIK
jgi:hypothetical protein